MRIKAKQIDALVGQARWNTSGIAIPNGSAVVVSAHFNGRLGGGSDLVAGVYTQSPQNKVYLRDKLSNKAITDGTFDNNQVYARLSEIENVWTLSFFTAPGGAESPFNFIGHPDLVGDLFDYRWCESIQLANAMPTAIVDVGESIDEILATSPAAHVHMQEELTVTADGQTSLTLAAAPKDPLDVVLTVNGLRYNNGVGKDFTVTDKTVIWTNLSFALETTDSVVVDYAY
jgi:hypothetical protein